MHPTVVAALVGLLGVLVSQFVAEKIRRRAAKADTSDAVTIRRYDHQEKFYEHLQARLGIMEREHDECERRCDRYRIALVEVRGHLGEIHHQITQHNGERPPVEELERLTVAAMGTLRGALNDDV